MINIILSILILSPIHSGRTDSRGGHNDNINGGYHYHHGYKAHSHKNGCPYETSANIEKSKKPSKSENKLKEIVEKVAMGSFTIALALMGLGIYAGSIGIINESNSGKNWGESKYKWKRVVFKLSIMSAGIGTLFLFFALFIFVISLIL